MKIAFLLSSFLPDHTGGTEVYVYRLIRHLQTFGVSCFVINSIEGEGATQYTYEGIRVFSIASAAINSQLRVEALSRLIETELPDIIHLHELIRPHGFTEQDLEFFHQSGIPLITTLHVSRYSCFMQDLKYLGKYECDGIPSASKCTRCFLSRKGMGIFTQPVALVSKFLYDNSIPFPLPTGKAATMLKSYSIVATHLAILKRILAISKCVVTVAQWYHDILKSLVPVDRLYFIPTGTLPLLGQTGKKRKGELVFGYLGRLTADKGIDLLIDSFLLSCKSIHQLKIFADISDQADPFIVSLLNKTRSVSNVLWSDPFHPDSISAILDDIDVVVVPTRITEMSPLVIHEAKAAGKFILASNNRGNIELLKYYPKSVIYQENSIVSLKSGIDKIIEKFSDLISVNIDNSEVTFEDTAREYHLLYTRQYKNSFCSVTSS